MYLYIKALHVISVISWMVGLLYLPRLYVYHTQAIKGGESDIMLQKMEMRLLRYIMNPAMVFSFIFGAWLVIFLGKAGLGGWFHAKVGCVFLLAGMHGFLAMCRKKFIAGTNHHSSSFYRIINEVPTILMITIVFLVIVKPW